MGMELIKSVIKSVPGAHSLYFPRRLRIALTYLQVPLAGVIKWLIHSKEISNFTYDLAAENIDYLTSFLAVILDTKPSVIGSYIEELSGDADLKAHLSARLKARSSKLFVDQEIRYGRRLGWYAVVRHLKPKVVIETGVDKGLGTSVLAAALLRNSMDGFPGHVWGIDIDPKAGWMLSGKYLKTGTIIADDAIAAIRKFHLPVDLYINDSDHSKDYEFREYHEIQKKLAPNAIVLGDNAHCSDSLFRYSREVDRQFLYWQEQPQNHWYRGGGIGASYIRETGSHAER